MIDSLFCLLCRLSFFLLLVLLDPGVEDLLLGAHMVFNLIQEVLQLGASHVLVVKVLLVVVLRVAVEDCFEFSGAIFLSLMLAPLSVELLLSDALKPVRFLGWLLSRFSFFKRHLLDFLISPFSGKSLLFL